jgi:hypothetical protein
MTLKEKVAKGNNERVDEKFIGGVLGCPSDYGLEPYQDRVSYANSITRHLCIECWNREYKEPANE